MLLRARSPMLLLASVAFLSCGPRTGNDPAPVPSEHATTAKFHIEAPSSAIDAGPDRTTVVVLTAVGEGADQAVFTVDALPRFATFEDNTLTLSPKRTDDGSYDVTVNATAGGQSDSKVLHIAVVAPNQPPDGLGLDHCYDGPYTDWIDGAGGMPFNDSCTANPTLDVGHLTDPDGDEVHLEVEVVPQGTALTRVATYTTGVLAQGLNDGHMHMLEVKNVPLNVPTLLAVRVVDARGAASSWHQTVCAACLPIGVLVPDLRYPGIKAGARTAVALKLIGVEATDTYALTLKSPPAFVSLTGTQLVVDATATDVGSYTLEFELVAKGYTWHRHLPLEITP